MAEPAAAAVAPPPVQPQAYDETGQPIAPDALPQAAAEGKAFFQKGARVYAKNARGALVTIAPEDASHPGYTILTPQQVEQAHAQKQYGEGLGNVAKASAAGAARGLTLGASDAVLAGLGGDDTRRALKGLREANPVASGVSELAGAVAPVVLSGGAAAPVEGAEALGAVARAGGLASDAVRAAGVVPRATAALGGIVERGAARGLEALGYEGKSLAGRVAAGAAKTAASGAAEGAVYGGAQAANDAVLNGDEITAEKIVAGMGHGALFGGGVGGVLGAAGPLATGIGNALIPKKASLEQLSREQAGRAAGFKPSDYKALVGRARGEAADTRIATTLDDLRNYEIKTGELKGQRLLQPADNAEQILDRVRYAKDEAGAQLGGLKKELSERMEAAGQSPDVGEYIKRVEDQVIKPLMSSKSPGAMGKARGVARELEILTTEHQDRIAAAAGDAEAAARAVPAPTFEELDGMRARLREVFQPPPAKGGGLPPPAPKSAKYLEQSERILADYLKESASGFLQKAGEDPNAYNEANRLFHSFRQLDDVGTKATAHNLGNRMVSPSDHALGLASFMGSMATGNVGALGAMAAGGAATIANKLLRERGNSLVADMARRAAELDGSIDRVAKVLAGHASEAKAPALAATFEGEGLRESYERTANRVRELAAPEAAMAHISSLIPEVAAQYPNVGAAVSTKLLAIYQQLAAKLPPSHVDTGTTLTPLAVRERVAPFAMRAFMSSARGALEPENVIKQMEHGIVDRDAVAMLKVAHPLTFQQLRGKVADYVEQRHDELPYKRRVMLSMTFDFTGDSSLDPTRMAGLQQVAQSLSLQEAKQNAKMTTPSPSSARKSKLGESLATPSSKAFGGT